MRYNKHELFALASQTSQNFDREGVMILKERQDGFFRRTEGCTVRWFRLRGNLLFYLKGPEQWYEPMGVIVLGNHQITTQNQDENGHWPFQIGWDNGVCYRLATFHESERTLWLKAIQLAPYESITSKMAELKTRLNSIRPVIDIDTYRQQKGVVADMNEVPLCELALSCDNLLCDTHGKPPSPVVVIFVQHPKGQLVRYGSTEIVETCSNPCFSKTILFKASDGLTGDVMVRIAVCDVKERVSETTIPMGYTSISLSTIQEAQRLRVALQTRDNKTVGFVTLNGWSLEPSYIGSSPTHGNDRNSIDIPQKMLCHRRSQSLPPRLGLKLKFPSYGTLIKQNFVNSHQVTYRFHSGLGGDITVHEVMAEAKLCFQMPIQLLDIFIQREKELLDQLLSVGEISSECQTRQLEFVSTHLSLLKHYSHSKRCLQAFNGWFKPSSRKDEPSLEFAPVNLHLQRMWVHNDTLNKTGFHDVITVGAFAAHAHRAERTGGLIRLVQQVKDINSTKAELSSMTSKLQTDYENIVAVKRYRDEISADMDRILMLVQAGQYPDVQTAVEGIKIKVKSVLALWDPTVVEESLSYIGWLKNVAEGSNNQPMSTVMRMTDQFNMFDTQMSSDCETFDASSSSSSKEASPMVDHPTLSSSVPDIKNNVTNNKPELHFHNDYFKSEREERSERSERSWNHSFRSVRSTGKPKLNEAQSLSFEAKRHGSFRFDFKSSASLEQVSYMNLVENINNKNDKTKKVESYKDWIPVPRANLDQAQRDDNLMFLKTVGVGVEDSLMSVIEAVDKILDQANMSGYVEEDFLKTQKVMESIKVSIDETSRWLRLSHAAMRLRCESPAWAREHAALQTRRDICFAQALTTVSTGLLCWLSSMPSEVVVKLLTYGLGPLCGFEGLLSLYSTEKAMWGDMVVAVEDLHTVVFTLTKVGHSNTAIPQVTGTRGALTVRLPVSDSLYGKFTSKEHLSFTITAIFFNVGINEKASLAEALGETTPQQHSNGDNLDRLNKYYHKFTKIFPPDPMEPVRASSRTKPLEEVMENLRIAVLKKVPKNTEVLHLAALATRLMNGIRFTSCKSAKDRTGMSVTLEQLSILASEYHLAEHEQKKALNIMRSVGCRRENANKNIGIKKYAFTKKQVMSLPEDYRPPTGIKSKVKSVLALWDPTVVEESLSYIGWLKNVAEGSNNQPMSTVMRMTDQFNMFDTQMSSDCETFDASSSSSSKEASPMVDHPTLSSSVPDIKNNVTNNKPELHFHNDYFKSEREERSERSERSWNHSFRSVRSTGKPKLNEAQSLSFEAKRHGSFRFDFKSSASLEQVSYMNLVENINNKNDKTKKVESYKDWIPVPRANLDQAQRDDNLMFLKTVGVGVEDSLMSVIEAVDKILDQANMSGYVEEDFLKTQKVMESIKVSIDETSRWLRLSHAAMRLRCESPAWAREHAALQTRRDICFAQALTTVSTGLLCWLSSMPSEVVVKLLTYGLGPLCGFEGLLSLYSTEKAMWGDMVVAVEDLHTVVFTLTKVGHSNTAIPQVTGTRGALTVRLPVSDSLYGKFTSKEHLSFTITAIFFNVGINEKASLAEALGETTPQQHSNGDNLDRLNKYYHKFTKIFPPDPMEPVRASSRTKPLEEVMENLRIAVLKKVPKNTEVLHLAALATRLMNGIRFTSCKSAKDRTGMSVTLEQLSILASEYHLAEHEQKKALNIMRSVGCRRENANKNIGIKKYAFTKKQVMSLPEDYRPPTGSKRADGSLDGISCCG